MGFRTGAFARIWSVESKGNYSVANISISKKNKDTEKYDVEFQDGFVRLVGNAHEFMQGVNIPEKGYPVKITSCDVTNKFDGDKKKLYYNFAIFGLEDANSGGNGGNAPAQNNAPAKAGGKKSAPKSDFAALDDDDAQLPF